MFESIITFLFVMSEAVFHRHNASMKKYISETFSYHLSLYIFFLLPFLMSHYPSYQHVIHYIFFSSIFKIIFANKIYDVHLHTHTLSLSFLSGLQTDYQNIDLRLRRASVRICRRSNMNWIDDWHPKLSSAKFFERLIKWSKSLRQYFSYMCWQLRHDLIIDNVFLSIFTFVHMCCTDYSTINETLFILTDCHYFSCLLSWYGCKELLNGVSAIFQYNIPD